MGARDMWDAIAIGPGIGGLTTSLAFGEVARLSDNRT
jgi:hypothetical protein